MILYHGSNVAIHQIDLSRCRPYKDFGKGFYLTTIEAQAVAMANRTTRIQGAGSPIVTIFDLDDGWRESGLNILEFSHPSREWAEFVVNNRDRQFEDLSSLHCNRLNQYDIVCDPVADDAIVASFQLYQDGRISIDELVERLRFRKLSDQLSFHTPAALQLLTQVEVHHDRY